MAEETVFENGRISNCHGLMTSTLTLDQVILYIIVHHSSTFTYMPNFIVDGHSDERTFETHFIRTTQKSQLNEMANHLAEMGMTGLLRSMKMKEILVTSNMYILHTLVFKLLGAILRFLPLVANLYVRCKIFSEVQE